MVWILNSPISGNLGPPSVPSSLLMFPGPLTHCLPSPNHSTSSSPRHCFHCPHYSHLSIFLPNLVPCFTLLSSQIPLSAVLCLHLATLSLSLYLSFPQTPLLFQSKQKSRPETSSAHFPWFNLLSDSLCSFSRLFDATFKPQFGWLKLKIRVRSFPDFPVPLVQGHLVLHLTQTSCWHFQWSWVKRKWFLG